MIILCLYLLVLIVFSNRYLFGYLLLKLKTPTHTTCIFEELPVVAIVVPMFNEGLGIQKTLQSLLAQNYPPEKLSVVVIDDCSTDSSFEYAQKAAQASSRVRVLRNPFNMGKRKSINYAVRETEAEIIVSVDSDVEADPNAISILIQSFTHENLAAVGGRVLVRNPHDNWLTSMQTIKYYLGYVFLKNFERSFSRVVCLSGCLTAYRRKVLLELEPILENRNILGVPIKYGEDRFLTRQILKAGYLTTLNLEALCTTTVPNTLAHYFAQQVRWRRSNIVDLLGGLSHIWTLHPAIALHYFAMGTLLLCYPTIVALSFFHGFFWPVAMIHLATLTFFACLYLCATRHDKRLPHIDAHAFLAMSVIMPASYLICTVLALFTLDSGSWETRQHATTALEKREPHQTAA